MKNRKKLIAALLVILVMALALAVTVRAWDYGSDIDYGGDSDWGGSSDWGSDSDWGGSSDWGSDSDWGGSGGFNFFPIIFGGSGTFIMAAIVLIVILVIVTIIRKKAGGSSGGQTQIQMVDTSNVNLHNLELLKVSDPNFSEAAMLSKVEHLFITTQEAYCSQNYEPVRPFLSNALYEQHVKQIQEKKARGERNVMSEMAVLMSKLENWQQDGHNEYLDVWLRVKYKSYIGRIDDPSQVVSGNPNRTFFIDFRWQFTRSAGSQTVAATDAVHTGHCPNCGAPINMNQSGKCEFCGSVISTTVHDWVLSKVDAIQQRSAGG